MPGQLASRHGLGGEAGVHTGLVQGQGIGGDEHADVWQDGHVVLPVAVAVGGDVHHQGDVELGPPVHHRLGILRHTAVQGRLGVVVGEVDSIEVAGPQAPATAHAVGLVHMHLPALLVKDKSTVGALLLAAAAAPAGVRGDLRLATGVLLLLPRPGPAAHADVLDGAAEAGHLVALEVGQADKHIGVHNGPADFGLFHIFTACDRDLHVVGALEAVADEDGTAHRQRRKAVLPCALQMLQSVLPAAGVHGVAVGEEGLASQLLDHVHYRPGVVGPQVADVAQLAEVHFDSHKFTVQVQILNPRPFHQLFQLGGKAVAEGLGVEVGEINLCFFHRNISF